MLKKGLDFLLENSIILIAGAFAGLLWANINHESYEHLLHFEIFKNTLIGYPLHDAADAAHGMRVINFHYLVNDILMAFFFAIAGKEVWEATLPGGPLSNAKKAAVPLISAVGGMIGPAAIYLYGAHLIGQYAEISNGWAIPCATDIAFSYLVARLIFGAGHPAVPFLLLLAIADDALGLLIIAVFYPQEEVKILWMLLPVIAVIIGIIMQKRGIHSFWPYLIIPGTLSWFGFALAGLHPSLGLLPIIPTLPHAHADKGLFNWADMEKHDTLNEFEHFWKNPVEVILGLFGLLNAGVVVGAIGEPTYLVLIGLLLGKPIGIWLTGMFTAKTLKFGLPDGLSSKDLFVLGNAAAIGFTVALFVSTVAFKPGQIQDAAKMGALLSFGAVLTTFIAAKIMRTKKAK
ncbi:MAG: sodium:proton antiporter [Calditrichaeota bacterium]|nr:MAG: sodium:proton antiporter [Calditrichota bacterium]